MAGGLAGPVAAGYAAFPARNASGGLRMEIAPGYAYEPAGGSSSLSTNLLVVAGGSAGVLLYELSPERAGGNETAAALHVALRGVVPLPAGVGASDVALDARRRVAYVACYNAGVAVVDLSDPYRSLALLDADGNGVDDRILGYLGAGSGSRSALAVDSDTGVVYLGARGAASGLAALRARQPRFAFLLDDPEQPGQFYEPGYLSALSEDEPRLAFWGSAAGPDLAADVTLFDRSGLPEGCAPSAGLVCNGGTATRRVVLSRLSARKTDARFNCFVQRPSDAYRLVMETGDAPSSGLPLMRTERGGALGATVSGLPGGGSAQARIAVSRPWIEWLDDSLVGDGLAMDVPDDTVAFGAKAGAPRAKLAGGQGDELPGTPHYSRKPPLPLLVEGQERTFVLRYHMDDPPVQVMGLPTHARRRFVLEVQDITPVVYGQGDTTVELPGKPPGTAANPVVVKPNPAGATDVAGKVNPRAVVPGSTKGGFEVVVTVTAAKPDEPAQRKRLFRVPVEGVRIQFGVDGDGDRKVGFDAAGDILGVPPENLRPDAKRLLFWANTDNDCAGGTSVDVGEQDDTPMPGEDGRHDSIRCARDLEDYTRAAIWLSENPGLRFELEMGAVGSGSPSVRMFETWSDGMADLQTCAAAASSLVPLVGKAERGVAAPLTRAPNVGVTTYLIDAPKPGRGNLQLIVSKGDRHVARLAVPVDFRVIGSFIEEYSLGDWEDGNGKGVPSPLRAATRVRTYQSPCDYDAAPGDNGSAAAPAAGCALDGTYVLFVHGHNYSKYAKEAWSATLFKRLWWAGYRGHFGYLRWPAGKWSGIPDTVLHREVFNDGEFNGWRSGAGLYGLLRDLRVRYPKLVVIAHSHGAVPLGEALRIARDRRMSDLVDTVITSQGALSAGYLMKWPPLPSKATSLVPPPLDVGNRFPDGAPGQKPYLWGIETEVGGRWYNFANREDFAVGNGKGMAREYPYPLIRGLLDGSAWVLDNNSKPLASRGYGWNDAAKRYSAEDGAVLLNPAVDGDGRYRTLAYANRCLGLPIGGMSTAPESASLGMADSDKFQTVDIGPFGFGFLQSDHSGAFIGAACARWKLYAAWLDNFGK